MLSAKLLLGEIATSLRQVIGPAISEPYPKAQAYMAATILDFISRQIEERGAGESKKTAIIESLFDDLAELGLPDGITLANSHDEAAVSALIEHLYRARGEIGEGSFRAANQRVRQTLRSLLDLDLEVIGKSGG